MPLTTKEYKSKAYNLLINKGGQLVYPISFLKEVS